MIEGFIPALRQAVQIFFGLLYVVLFIRIILSWFRLGTDNRFMQLLYAFTEPVLAPIRNLVHRSPLGGPGMILDFSPIIAFVLIRFVSSLIDNFLRGFL